MSATDPLRRGPGRGRMRAVEPAGAETRPDDDRRALEIVRCSYRPADADFYYWKYGVWYNLMDCCYRHHERTYEGCADCGQGSGNLRQNRDRFAALGAGRRGPARP